MRALVAGLATALALVWAPGALAAECPKTTLGDVEDEVMCPVCGTPLALATEAPQAQRERELIQRLIERCRSKKQIKATLAAQLGDSVLALPGDEGFDLAAYLVPGLALLLAGGGLAAAAIRWRSSAGAGPEDPAVGPGSVEARRLDDDLERYEL